MAGIKSMNTDITEEYYITRVLKEKIYDINKTKYPTYVKVNNITILKVERIGDSDDFEIRLVKSDTIDDSYYFEEDLTEDINKLGNNQFTDVILVDKYFFEYNDLSMDNLQYDVYHCAKKREGYKSDNDSESYEEEEEEIKPVENDSESEEEEEGIKPIRNKCKYKTEALKDTKHIYDRQVIEKIYPEVIPKEITNYTNIVHITVINIQRKDDNNYEVVLVKGSRVRDALNFRNDIAHELSKRIYNDSKITLTLDTEFLKYNYIKMYKEFNYDFDSSRDSYNDKHVYQYNADLQEQYKRDKEYRPYTSKPSFRKLCKQCNREETKKGTLCNKCLYKKEKQNKQYVICYFCHKKIEKDPDIITNHISKHKKHSNNSNNISREETQSLCSECRINDKEPNRSICKKCYYEKRKISQLCKYCNEKISKKHMERHIQRKHPEKA